jgi:hypothetical protein
MNTREWRKLKTRMAFLAAVMGIAVMSGASFSQTQQEIHLTIDYDRSPGSFEGEVDNLKRDRCERFRVVKVKKVRRNGDLTVGSDSTNQQGKWLVPYPDARGKYYARAPKMTYTDSEGRERSCARLGSPTIRVR